MYHTNGRACFNFGKSGVNKTNDVALDTQCRRERGSCSGCGQEMHLRDPGCTAGVAAEVRPGCSWGLQLWQCEILSLLSCWGWGAAVCPWLSYSSLNLVCECKPTFAVMCQGGWLRCSRVFGRCALSEMLMGSRGEITLAGELLQLLQLDSLDYPET